MDYLAENAAAIVAALTAIGGAIVTLVSFMKALKSERRTKTQIDKNTKDIIITREGIVQGFKDAVVTKDLKVSINKHVEKILDNKFDKLLEIISKNEERRTKLAYWSLKVLEYTAAFDKFTTEEKSEIYELLAMIDEEEQIVETAIKEV